MKSVKYYRVFKLDTTGTGPEDPPSPLFTLLRDAAEWKASRAEPCKWEIKETDENGIPLQ